MQYTIASEISVTGLKVTKIAGIVIFTGFFYTANNDIGSGSTLMTINNDSYKPSYATALTAFAGTRYGNSYSYITAQANTDGTIVIPAGSYSGKGEVRVSGCWLAS